MGDSHLAYQRAKFSTRLPTDRLFTRAHFWIAPAGEGLHRVGFTRFATRMLGEVVEFDFEVAPGDRIEQGQAIGWVEGFKAVTDLYSPLGGHFAGANPELEEVVERIHRAPYDEGWLYLVAGTPPTDCVEATDYAAFLDTTIDKMTGKGS